MGGSSPPRLVRCPFLVHGISRYLRCIGGLCCRLPIARQSSQVSLSSTQRCQEMTTIVSMPSARRAKARRWVEGLETNRAEDAWAESGMFPGTSQETCPVPRSCSNHPDRRHVCIVLLGPRCKMMSCGQRGRRCRTRVLGVS